MTKTKTDKMNLKKAVYIFLTVILGTLLGLIAYGLSAITCAKRGPLPVSVFWILILAGAVTGLFLGFRWWRMVYIEHRHWHNWREKRHHNK